MNVETVTLRCDDGLEAVVFIKRCYDNMPSDYEIFVEDSYIGGEYKGFLGRLRRAWKALTNKPVMYTGIYCEDKEKIRKFLTDSLALLDNIEETP